jgi:outer membrane lipoprotein-sorting protein
MRCPLLLLVVLVFLGGCGCGTVASDDMRASQKHIDDANRKLGDTSGPD